MAKALASKVTLANNKATAPAKAPVTTAPAQITAAPGTSFFASLKAAAKAAVTAPAPQATAPATTKAQKAHLGISLAQCQQQAALGTVVTSKNMCAIIAALNGLPPNAVITWGAHVSNPWPKAPAGAAYYRAALHGHHNGITVAQAIANATQAKVGHGNSGALGGHLVWFCIYLAGTCGVQVNGQSLANWQGHGGTHLWQLLQTVINNQAAPATAPVPQVAAQ